MTLDNEIYQQNDSASKTVEFPKSMNVDFPLDKVKMMEILGNLSEDNEARWGFVDHFGKLIADLSCFKDIFSCVGDPERSALLIDSLKDDQMLHFSLIMNSIRKIIEIEDFRTIQDSLMNVKTSTEENIEKAEHLLAILSKNDEKSLAMMTLLMLKTSHQYRWMGDILFKFLRRSEGDRLVEQIARFYEDDLDQLILMAKLLEEHYGNKKTNSDVS
jgi:hypothetical protein